MKNEDFALLLVGGARGKRLRAVADECEEEEAEEEVADGALALGDVVGPVLAGEDLAAWYGPSADIGRCTVHWTLSHASGEPRGLVRCDIAGHRNCFKYRQLNQDPDRETTIGYLAVWAEMGAGMDRAEHQQPYCIPIDARIHQWAALAV